MPHCRGKVIVMFNTCEGASVKAYLLAGCVKVTSSGTELAAACSSSALMT